MSWGKGILFNVVLVYLSAHLCLWLCEHFGSFNIEGIKRAQSEDDFQKSMPDGWVAPLASSALFGASEPATSRVIVMSSDAYMGLTLVIITVCMDFLIADLLLLSAFHTSLLALVPALAHTVLSISASSVLLAIVLGVIPLTADQLWYQSWVYWLCDTFWVVSLMLMALTVLGFVDDDFDEEDEAQKEKVTDKTKEATAPLSSPPKCIKKIAGTTNPQGRLRAGDKTRSSTCKAVKSSIVCEKERDKERKEAAVRLRNKKAGCTNNKSGLNINAKCASASHLSDKDRTEMFLRGIKRDVKKTSAGSCPTILSEQEKAEIDLRVNKYVAERVAQMRAEISRQRDEGARLNMQAGLDSPVSSRAG